MLKEAKKPINDFLNTYKSLVMGKKDYQINWISVGYKMQEQICILFKTNPKLVKTLLNLEDDEEPVSPQDRKYMWIDGYSFYNKSYSKEEMEQSYNEFMKKNYNVEYNLKNTGPYGDLDYCIPYLSYAYGEKQKWDNLIEKIERLLY